MRPPSSNNVQATQRLAVLLANTRGGSETLVLSSAMRARSMTSRSTSRVVGVSEAASTSLKALGVALLGNRAGRGEGGESHDGDDELLCRV